MYLHYSKTTAHYIIVALVKRELIIKSVRKCFTLKNVVLLWDAAALPI